MNTMNINISLILIILISASCNYSSSKDGSKEALEDESAVSAESYIPVPREERERKYYTAQTSGKWKEQAHDHIPNYTITNDKKYKYINVMIPFKGAKTPPHYIEAIILTDHNHKELQKKVFNIGNQSASAIFKLKKGYRSFIYIISKCNLHDMWEVKVFL